MIAGLIGLKAITKARDVVAVESLTYFGLLHVIVSLSLKTLELPAAPEGGINIDTLEEAVKRKQVKACLLDSSFNNPLEYSMGEQKKRKVLEIL